MAGSIGRLEALEEPELTAFAEPLDELPQVGALDFAPLVFEADDGVGGGGRVHLGSARETSSQHRQDFFSVHRDGRLCVT